MTPGPSQLWRITTNHAWKVARCDETIQNVIKKLKSKTVHFGQRFKFDFQWYISPFK